MKMLRDAALAYADRGWKVIPLRPGTKIPLGRLVPNGKDDATDDLATVFRWWRAAPRANVGIVAGPSGLAIVDVDPRHGGDESMHELEQRLGALPQTIESHSGGGGRHLLFRHPGGILRSPDPPAVDVKDAGYIVAPPSIHPDTRRPYVWSVDGDPDEVELADLPDRWIEALRTRTRDVDLTVNVNHGDALRNFHGATYVAGLTGRPMHGDGWFQCPFHKGGGERTPSFKVDGTVWACYGSCQPIGNRRVAGGNIYDFAALLWDYPLPLRGTDFLDVSSRLRRELGVTA